jgi:endonuclease YncB( thermonuclease family)
MKVKAVASSMAILLFMATTAVFFSSNVLGVTYSDISVAMKASKKTVIVSMKNNDDTPIYKVQIKAQEGEIRYIKALNEGIKDWDAFKIDPSNAVIETHRRQIGIIGPDERPITQGRNLIILLVPDKIWTGIQWVAFDAESNTLSHGTTELQGIKPDSLPQTPTIYDRCNGFAACFPAKVNEIVAGDTIDVKTGRKTTTIELALVNTPDKDNPLYKEAKQFTATLCPVGSRVLIDEEDRGAEVLTGDNMVAKVFCGDKVLNAELLYAKLAVIDTEYCFASEFAYESWAQEYGC